MNNSKSVILITKTHPFFELIKNSKQKYIEVDLLDSAGSIKQDLCQFSVFDFCILSSTEKSNLLTLLNSFKQVSIYSDLGPYRSSHLIEQFKNIVGCFSCSFYSDKKVIEVYSENKDDLKQLELFFDQFSYSTVSSLLPETGFIYPRVISQIINEAYFSLEDEMASAQDIDRAMKYGVNYPEGPIKLSQLIGLDKICLMLNQLYTATQDDRYKCSPMLLAQAQKMSPELFEQ